MSAVHWAWFTERGSMSVVRWAWFCERGSMNMFPRGFTERGSKNVFHRAWFSERGSKRKELVPHTATFPCPNGQGLKNAGLNHGCIVRIFFRIANTDDGAGCREAALGIPILLIQAPLVDGTWTVHRSTGPQKTGPQ